MNFARMCLMGTVASVWLLGPAPARAQDVPAPVDQYVNEEAIGTNQWIASGHLGSSFGDDVDGGSVNYGGALTYLRNGLFGAEFLAGVSPDLDLNFGFADESNVGTYMVNAIAAAPLGTDGRWQPFVSGGFGAMTLNSTLVGEIAPFDVDDTQAGGNIGFGLLAFSDRWGLRSELRYFAGFGDAFGDGADADMDPEDLFESADLLSDVSFWRGSVGVAYRW